MATEVIKIIDPDNGSGTNYTSLSAWEAGEQGDLTGVRDEIAVAKCRCTGGTADTSVCDINGWTTDSTHYIKVWTDTSESYRHTGKWVTGNKYRLEGTSTNPFINRGEYVYVDGLQILATGSDCHCVTMTDTNFTWVSNCVLKGDDNSVGIFNEYASSGSYLYVWNCVLHTFYRGIMNYSNTTAYIYNCTIADCTNVGVYNLVTAYCKNVISANIGATGGDFNNSGTMTNTNCASLDETADDYGGSGNQVSCTFSFVDANNFDYHLLSTDTGAKGLGANLYNDATLPFQTDIDGQDRGGSGAQWDIGADEYVAAGNPYYAYAQQ